MSHRIAFMLVGLLLVAPAARAQRVEGSVSYGYGASEGVTSNRQPLLGQQYDALDVTSGAGFNFTFGVFVSESAQVEFLFAKQNSQLDATGPGGNRPVSELSVYNYMFNYVYNAGDHDASVRPYFFGGIGATNYAFGANLLTGSTGDIGSETRFASNWGAGVKFYMGPNVGAKVGVRWTPTYIKSTAGGVWCDPFYGCWPLADNQYSHQFETSVGLTVRF